jgi:GDP/UDP-N,N'-diacetylbacillosamine 2-epimerase (hydrolysing)
VITGTRAEYGLLRRIMFEIQNSNDLLLQTIVTGTHLSEKFGMTVKEIEADGFQVDTRVEILTDEDTEEAISGAIAKGITGFSRSFEILNPDLIVVLGDRFEILSAAISAQVFRIPVAHIHGGESTEGLIDEAFRHAITKMSHLHFVAAEDYRKRVIQLGENPKNVFLVGGLGVDAIMNENLYSKAEIEEKLSLTFKKRSLLVTFHPVTLENHASKRQLDEIIKALAKLKDTTLIFTMPNADMENKLLSETIYEFSRLHGNAYCFESLGQKLFLSCLQIVDGVVGNSSSGLTEVPTFRKGTINIGDRQRGRLRAESVIDCSPDEKSIDDALLRLYSSDFQQKLAKSSNPYGNGGATVKIIEVIREAPLETLLKKQFYNLEVR